MRLIFINLKKYGNFGEHGKLKWPFTLILIINSVVLDEVQYAKDRFTNYFFSSFPLILL